MIFNPFKHNVKWSNILQKSCGVQTATSVKYVWLFFNITHESVKDAYKLLNSLYIRKGLRFPDEQKRLEASLKNYVLDLLSYW